MKVTSENLHPGSCADCKANGGRRKPGAKLCPICRKDLSKLRIPLWVKVFSALVLVFGLAASFRLPAHLSAAIHYERAANAEKEKRYFTAAREYDAVLEAFPGSKKANAKALVAYYHDLEISKAAGALSMIRGMNIEDEELAADVNEAITGLNNYFTDSVLMILFDKDTSSHMVKKLEEHLVTHPRDAGAMFLLARRCFDNKEIKKADSIADVLLSIDPDHYPALGLMAAVKREEGEYDEAIAYLDQMLEFNIELTAALAGKARVEMKRMNDKEAIALAEQAAGIDPSDMYSLETLAMAYHFSNRKGDCEKTINKMKKIAPNDKRYLPRLMKVVNGTEKYR